MVSAACRLILGDIILSINGKRINSASDLYRILDKCGVGDTVGLRPGGVGVVVVGAWRGECKARAPNWRFEGQEAVRCLLQVKGLEGLLRALGEVGWADGQAVEPEEQAFACWALLQLVPVHCTSSHSLPAALRPCAPCACSLMSRCFE